MPLSNITGVQSRICEPKGYKNTTNGLCLWVNYPLQMLSIAKVELISELCKCFEKTTHNHQLQLWVEKTSIINKINQIKIVDT